MLCPNVELYALDVHFCGRFSKSLHIFELLPFVLNQVDAVTAAVEGGHHHLLHES